jgi:hypothetical protein
MFSTKRVAGFAGVLVTFFSIGWVVPASGQGASRSVLRWEELTNQQFHRLPDSQAILYLGKQTTLGEMRAQWRAKRQQAAAKAKAGEAQAKSKFKALQNKGLQDQQAKQAAAGAKVKAQLSRLRQQEAGAKGRPGEADTAFEQIRREAIQLYNSSKKARSAAEKARIDQRAKQLLEQLRRMGKA